MNDLIFFSGDDIQQRTIYRLVQAGVDTCFICRKFTPFWEIDPEVLTAFDGVAPQPRCGFSIYIFQRCAVRIWFLFS